MKRGVHGPHGPPPGSATGCGWNLCVWLEGVVVRRYTDFLMLLIPILLVYICSILQQHPYFLFIFLCFSFLFGTFCKKFLCILYLKLFWLSINTHMGDQRKPYEGLHIMFYTRKSTHKPTLHILRCTSAVCLQEVGCRSRSRGRALYRDASRAAHVLGPPPSRAEISN